VVVPTDAPPSGRVVLIDRVGTNVITWADPVSGVVQNQLKVGTGFESNPYDYVELDATRAVVSRYGLNPNPGQVEYDTGDDLLVLDTKTPSIVGRVALPKPEGWPARPSAMTRIGGHVAVVLQRLDLQFVAKEDGAVAFVNASTLAVDQLLDLPGVRNCGQIAVSPAGTQAVVACSGTYDVDANRYDASVSDVVLLDVSKSPAAVVRALALPKALGSSIQPEVAFATDDTIVVKTYATADNKQPETVWAVSLGAAAPVQIHAAESATFALGALRCGGAPARTCLLADAEVNVLRRWSVGTTLTALEPVIVETAIGLPPRHLGAY
jgi:hypothetical protein